MLDYLDRLCAALLGREVAEIRRLLRHPLARTLPRIVREEAQAIAAAPARSLRAPIQTLRFYQQTMQLLAEPAEARSAGIPDVAPRPEEPAAAQLELPIEEPVTGVTS